MLTSTMPDTGRFTAYGVRHLPQIGRRFGLPERLMDSVRLFSQVLPFRVNEYVLSELIDWSQIPDDPMFQMVFPQPGMLTADDERRVGDLLARDAPRADLLRTVNEIRQRLNPHPSGQTTLNVPEQGGAALAGVQHKYRETVLYFPAQGQTCHAYCTYCFRWAQFVGDQDLRFAATDPSALVEYLRAHPAVSDVLVTGGDPMIMSAAQLRRHLMPLLEVDTVRTIRIGTKVLAYWPQRFVTDRDAAETLALYEDIVARGRTLAVMAQVTHPRELSTALAGRALALIRGTGAVVYCQAPLVRRVNNDPRVWEDMWRAQISGGAVPYYLFVARDTGPRNYFEVSLERAFAVYIEAYRRLSGLARTVRGPVMSTTPGKVVVDGVDDAYLHLRFLQARDPGLVGRPFRAHLSAEASWLTDLRLTDDCPADIRAAVHPPGGRPPNGEHADD